MADVAKIAPTHLFSTSEISNLNVNSRYDGWIEVDGALSSPGIAAEAKAVGERLASYFDKQVGGEISGDVKILNGNYVQTGTPLNVHNYSAANSFMQAESIKYGDPAIGSKAYCILSVVVPEKAIIISGDLGYSDVASKQYPTQSSSKTFRNGLGNGSVSLTLKHSLINASNANPCLSDLMWSLALFDIGDTNFGHLTVI